MPKSQVLNKGDILVLEKTLMILFWRVDDDLSFVFFIRRKLNPTEVKRNNFELFFFIYNKFTAFTPAVL